MLSPIQIEEAFIKFLICFQDNHREIKYKKSLSQMIANEKKSIIIDFKDLYSYDENLANLVLTYPYDYLPHLDFASISLLRLLYPNYANQIQRMNVRFRNLPSITYMKQLCVKYIGSLLEVHGIVVRASAINPIITISAHLCINCGEILYQKQSGKYIESPAICPTCNAKHFDLLLKKSTFDNSQLIAIQELFPHKSRQLNVELKNDIVNLATIGDKVSVIGSFKLVKEYRRRLIPRTFDYIIEANNIEILKKNELDNIN